MVSPSAARNVASENEALRRQLAEQARKLARFGSLRDRVGTMEPELRDAVIEGMSQQAAVAESALAADMQDALDLSSFEMDSLAAARGSARRLVATALALGEEKKFERTVSCPGCDDLMTYERTYQPG